MWHKSAGQLPNIQCQLGPIVGRRHLFADQVDGVRRQTDVRQLHARVVERHVEVEQIKIPHNVLYVCGLDKMGTYVT